jgi:hypothetical protein
MSSKISQYVEQHPNATFHCEFGVVKVPAHNFLQSVAAVAVDDGDEGEQKAPPTLLKDDPDRDSLWCEAPRVMSCGRVPFALYAERSAVGLEKILNQTVDKFENIDMVYENLELGKMVTYTYKDKELQQLGYDPAGVNVHMTPTRGECIGMTEIRVSGLNLDPMPGKHNKGDKSKYGCRFGNRVVPAFLEHQEINFDHIGTSSSSSSSSSPVVLCHAPTCIVPGEVRFAVVALDQLKFDTASALIAPTSEHSHSPNTNRVHQGWPNMPETDLTKDALFFTWYDTHDNVCSKEEPCAPPLTSANTTGPSWQERAYCVIGGTRSKAFWDPGTLATTTTRPGSTNGRNKTTDNHHGIKDHVGTNTRVVRRSPSFKCIAPRIDAAALSVPLYLIVDGTKQNQFTYQQDATLVVYDRHQVHSLDPPHGSCGAKLSIVLEKALKKFSNEREVLAEGAEGAAEGEEEGGEGEEEGEEEGGNTAPLVHPALGTKAVLVNLGTSASLACMYDTSPRPGGNNNRVRCLQPTPLLPPGGIPVRVSPDQGQNMGFGGARWVSYDAPHAGTLVF